MISVIVPCYNVEKYLERCVNSILSQTYYDLEIILVNDGSIDKTGEICEKFAKKDPRVKTVHKENGGLSDARNAGIDVAKGDFYAFVDGDDFVEPDAYEAMISEMKNPNVSLVVAGIFAEDIDGSKNIVMSKEYLILDRKEAFINLLGPTRTIGIGHSSCNKLFRKQLFSGLRYKKGIVNEDMEILPQILDACNYVVLLNKPIYHYVKRADSITETEFNIWKYESINIPYNVLSLCKEKYPELIPYANYYVMDSLFKILEELTNSKNRKIFYKQEFVIRKKMIVSFFECMKSKDAIKECWGNVKNMMIWASLGTNLTEKLVSIKRGFLER